MRHLFTMNVQGIFFFFFLNVIYLFIYLWLLLFVAVRGLLTEVASIVAEHELWAHGLQ